MPQPLRKVRQRIAKADMRPPRVLLHLPFLGVAALLLVFAVAVGWAFFMGVIVGKGQNPAERVSAMLHEPPQEATPPAGVTAGEAVAELLDRPLPLHGEGASAAAQTADGEAAGADRQEKAAQAASGQQVQPPQEPAPQQQAEQAAAERPKAPAYPFARPQGESLAAWGIEPAAPQPVQPDRSVTAAQKTPAAPRQAERKPAPSAEPKFDYVYQAAAFRGREDGDALRARLEEKGLRTRLQKSGRVYLVQVLLRGSEREAENVRETLRRMGLGKPIRLSKKAVK